MCQVDSMTHAMPRNLADSEKSTIKILNFSQSLYSKLKKKLIEDHYYLPIPSDKDGKEQVATKIRRTENSSWRQ